MCNNSKYIKSTVNALSFYNSYLVNNIISLKYLLLLYKNFALE